MACSLLVGHAFWLLADGRLQGLERESRKQVPGVRSHWIRLAGGIAPATAQLLNESLAGFVVLSLILFARFARSDLSVSAQVWVVLLQGVRGVHPVV